MTSPTRRGFLATAAAIPLAYTFGKAKEPEGPKPISIAAGNNAFACELYGQLKSTKENVFFSPFSIEAALAMTSVGANGNTLVEMQKTLHLPLEVKLANAGFKAMIAALNNDKVPAAKRGYELSVANALWGMKGYPWRKEFLTTTNENYGAGLIDTDFTMPDAARGIINAWVEKETRDKIKNLIPKGALTPLTRLVLTNAIYFKGTWEVPFEKSQTKKGPFHAGGEKHEIPLMHRHAAMGYAETADYQAIELPYKGRETSMLVWLPRKAEGFADLEKKLSGTTIADTVKALQPRITVDLTLPRFKVETESSLREPLEALGMKDVFDEKKADLTRMHSGREALSVSAVLHKAFVDVNEEGTEAAAATGVIVGATSAPIPVEPKVFRADRPFLFAIRHTPSNTVLFLGRLSKIG